MTTLLTQEQPIRSHLGTVAFSCSSDTSLQNTLTSSSRPFVRQHINARAIKAISLGTDKMLADMNTIIINTPLVPLDPRKRTNQIVTPQVPLRCPFIQLLFNSINHLLYNSNERLLCLYSCHYASNQYQSAITYDCI